VGATTTDKKRCQPEGWRYINETAGPELRDRPFEFYDAWDLAVSAAVSATTTV
jgi:hypothetical protein